MTLSLSTTGKENSSLPLSKSINYAREGQASVLTGLFSLKRRQDFRSA